MNFIDFAKQMSKKIDYPFFIKNYFQKNAYFWIGKIGAVIGSEICHYEFIAVNEKDEVIDNVGNSSQPYNINLEIHFEFEQKDDYVWISEILKLRELLGKNIQYRYNQNQVGIVFASLKSTDKKLIKKAKKVLNKMDKKFTKHITKVFTMERYKKNNCVSLEKVFFAVVIIGLIAIMSIYLFLEKDVFSKAKFNFSQLCYSILTIVAIICFTIFCLLFNKNKVRIQKLKKLSNPIDSIEIQDFEGDLKLSENNSIVTNEQITNNHSIEYYPVNKASVDLYKAYAATIENI